MADFPSNRLIDSPVTFTQAPTRLTSVVPVKTTDSHDILSGVQYEIDGCGDDYVEIDWDNYDDCIRTAEKEFPEGLAYTESIGDLGILAAIKCRPGAIGGGTDEEYQARVERKLVRVESAFLEAKLAAYVTAEGTAETSSASWDIAIGKLLLRTGDLNGKILLHLPNDVAYAQGSKLDNLDDLGVTLVTSPKYTFAFITGAINIWGSEAVSTVVPSLDDNYTLALAERQYLMTIECEPYRAAIS